MAVGYTRQSTITTGAVITATIFNDEYNQIVSAFNASTGHNHDGTAGGGAPIPLASGVSGTLPVANGGTGASTAAAARTALGLEIDTDVLGVDAGLVSIAGLTTAADKMIYTTASDVYAVTGLTSAGRALLDDVDASAQRTTLGLGTIATQAASNVSITGGSVTGVTLSWANASEINTGTEAAKVVTPDALAGSNVGTFAVSFTSDPTIETEVGNGYLYAMIPPQMDGMNLVAIYAYVITAGETDTLTIQLHNQTNAVDMLSTELTIDSNENTSLTAAEAPVINASNDGVSSGDILRLDIDAVHDTPAKGLQVYAMFRKP